MKDDFHWEVEEEIAWGSPLEAEAQHQRRWWPLPRWLQIGMGMVGLTAVLLTGYYYWQTWRLNRAATDELTAAHGLLQETIARRDQELFQSMVQPEDEEWLAAQQRLFRAGLPQQLPIMGLQAAELDQGAIEDITFSPDFGQAAVVARQPFVTVTRDASATVFLQQTTWYERGETGWQLAPVADEADYWGRWQETRRPFLTVKYPERDRDISQRLADDINSAMSHVCAASDVDCSNNFHLNIHFNTDLLTLADFAFSQQDLSINRQGYRDLIFDYPVTMPTPSLIGLPTDEAGYQALSRGYASWAAAQLVINFGAEEVMTAETASQRLARWDLILPSAAVAETAAATLPEQDVLLLCQYQTPYLLRYNPTTGEFTEEAALDELGLFVEFWPLPDDSGVALGAHIIGLSAGAGRWQLWVWQEGESVLAIDKRVALEQQTYVNLVDARFHSPSRLYWQASSNSRRNGYQVNDFLHINLDGCIRGDCLEAPAEKVIVSPNGRYSLHTPDAQGGILTDLETMVTTVVPEVRGWVVWADDHTLVYVDGTDRAEAIYQLQLHEGRATQPTLLLTLDELQNEAPAEVELFLQDFMVNPRDANQLLITTGTYLPARQAYGSFLYTYDLTDAHLQRVAAGDVEEKIYIEPELINGRYFVSLVPPPYTDDLGSASQAYLTIKDLVTEKQRTHVFTASLNAYRYDWSQDGNWVLLLEDGLLRLISPADDSQQTLFHRFYDCSHAAWVNR